VDLTNLERSNPDYFAVEVMDEAFFSGGFSARLMEAIRTKRGLAYSAGGGFSAPFDHPGTFVVVAGTKSTSAVETVQAMRDAIQEDLKKPATEDELKRAKDSILNSFIFRFDSKDKILFEQMAYDFYGYPLDFLARYRAGVEKVTAADVTRVAQKYIHPDELAVLVVGNAQEFDKPLASLGPVTNIDISIPAPPTSASAQARPANPQ
jgi:zinc protease